MDNLSKIAIVGTERKPVSEALFKSLIQLGIDCTDASAPEVVLRGLAAHHIVCKASGMLLRDVSLKPTVQSNTILSLHPCPYFVEDTIRKILQLPDFHQALLPEIMRMLGKHQVAFPRQYIPLLLEKCYRDAGFLTEVNEYLDDHVAWVASLHPRWKCLLPQSMEKWDTSPYMERQKWLQQGLRLLPKEARAALSATWANEKAEHQVRFLELLSDCIVHDDRQLLTKAIQTDHQSVRLIAAKCIRVIAKNDHTAKAEAFFEQHYAPFYKGMDAGGEMLGVALSDENAPDIQYFKSFLDKYRKPDWRWYMFLQVVAAIPPPRLVQLTKRPLVELIRRVRKLSDFQAASFVTMAADMAEAFGSIDLCKALLEECSDMLYHQEHLHWANDLFCKLLMSLQSNNWEEMVAVCLSKNYNFAWKAIAERPGVVSNVHIVPILQYLKAQGQQSPPYQRNNNPLLASLEHKLSYSADAATTLQELSALEEANQGNLMDFVRDMRRVLELRVELKVECVSICAYQPLHWL